MPFNKLDYETFYSNLRKMFPRIEAMNVWTEWEFSNESGTHSVIMSELAREMIVWASEGQFHEVKRLLEYIDKAFEDANDAVISIIGTDFTVTILECEDKFARETIKSLMPARLANAYQINLRGYIEPN